MEQNLTDFFKTVAIVGVAVMGWMVKQAIQSFKESIQNLNKTLEKLDETVNQHNVRISVLEKTIEEKI